jgi:glycosyltransferase involved in cell wall biosynthesis
MLPLTQQYLIVIGIECFVDGSGKRYVDPLWYKDLVEHFRYIKWLTLAVPCARQDPPNGAVRVDNDPLFVGTQFVDLPRPTSFGQALLSLPSSAKTLWKAVGNTDIVHSAVGGWPVPLGWLAMPIAIMRKKKTVIIVESAFWRLHRDETRTSSLRARLRAYASEAINRWCVNHADLSIFTQPEYQKSLLTKGLHRGHVINASWIDEEKVMSDAEAVENWRSKAIAGGALKVLFVGRLVADKGVLILLEAMKKLDEERIPIELDVLGEGELLTACVSCSRELKNAAVIRVLGTVPYSELFEVLRRYHAVVAPSLSDEQPRIVYDAYSQAVPMLASDTPGLRICIENEKTGLLASRNNPDAFAALLRRAQANISELANMGTAALNVARGQTHRLMHERRWVLLVKLLSSRAKQNN